MDIHGPYSISVWDTRNSQQQEISRQLPSAPDAIVTCVGSRGPRKSWAWLHGALLVPRR